MAEFTIEHLAPETLVPNSRNYRLHPERQLQAVQESIDAFGWLAAPIVNRRTGLSIVDGHARVDLALARGEKKIPCRVIDVSPEDEARILAVFDKSGELRERDDVALAALLKELADTPEGLPSAWTKEELGDLLLSLAPAGDEGLALTDPDAVPDDAPTRCHKGDVWAIGPHRLLIGDATDAETVRGFLAGEEIALVWTDPPYGVSYSDKNEFLNTQDGGKRNTRKIQNDAMTEEATETLCCAALSLACDHAVPGAVCYVACPAGTALPFFIRAFQDSGFQYRHSLVWVKNNFVLGRCDYHYRHEVILYGWKEGAHFFVEEHNHSSVFEVPKPHRSAEHPTMKPVALIEPMLRNSSRPGDTVYDPFFGSGSTLVACIAAGRVFRGTELEPCYGDVAIARAESALGIAAEKVSQS